MQQKTEKLLNTKKRLIPVNSDGPYITLVKS
jgi:hypothetical protein